MTELEVICCTFGATGRLVGTHIGCYLAGCSNRSRAGFYQHPVPHSHVACWAVEWNIVCPICEDRKSKKQRAREVENELLRLAFGRGDRYQQFL